MATIPARLAPWRLAAGVIAGAVLLSGSVIAGPAPLAQAAEAAEPSRWQPTAIPDRLVLTPASDPTTQQTITWRTSAETDRGLVQYRTLTAAPYPGSVLETDAAHTEVTTDLGYAQNMHSATIADLQPGVEYMYRVGDGTNFSEWQDFSTASATDDTTSFIFLGDIQNGILSDGSRVLRNAFRDRPNADAVVQIGDLVNDANSDAEWGQLFDAFSYTLGTQNLITTPGNHEYDGGLSRTWRAQLPYPATGPQGEGEIYEQLAGTVYYTDREGVRFISLNSNIASEEGLRVQADWLTGVLSDNPNTWTVVLFHHPVYSLDEGRNNLGIRTVWGPILEEYNVDLVLQGHDHAYGRGNTLASEENLPEGADPELSSTGPVYIGSSASVKLYEYGPRHWNENDAHLRRLDGGKQFYQLVDVVGGTLRYEARTADGEFFDGVTITKDENGKLVTDGVEPQDIGTGPVEPCLGCGGNPDPDPGEIAPDVPTGEVDYEVTDSLSSVNVANAKLPAGAAYSESRDVLYLGDQNSRKIFEIDPETDAVLREMTLPENIRDLGIDDENDLLYVGQQNRNWVVVST
ncbi:metallophosphoesterase family protein, partial [Microbacterium sp.]|uniref:purple acid phosphatase family protein n=1 Tax=Microbacterium sp. TaxID=51671 RepID=UPI002736FB8A